MEVKQDAFAPAVDHDGLRHEAERVQGAAHKGVDVHVRTGAPFQNLPRRIGDQPALFIPFDPVRDVLPRGDDPLLVTLDPLQGRFQLLGIPELTLDDTYDVGLRDGLVHIRPPLAEALVHRSGNAHARKVVHHLGPVLGRAVAERFARHRGEVHRVVVVEIFLVGQDAARDGHLLARVVMRIGRRDVAPLGLVDMEVFRDAHRDVRLIDGDGQL